jgi:hypothetical protein
MASKDRSYLAVSHRNELAAIARGKNIFLRFGDCPVFIWIDKMR